MDIFFKHSTNQWEGHPLPAANALDLQQLYKQLNELPPTTSNTIRDRSDETLEILSQEFLRNEENNNVTTQREEDRTVSCVQTDKVTHGTTVSPKVGLLHKTRRGRIIKRPIRLGFDD